MKVNRIEVLRIAAVLALACVPSRAADWLTDGADVQRTNWQKDETILTTANAKDIKLLWKVTVENKPRQMHALFPPLIAGRVDTPDGAKEIALVAGVSDNLYAIDVAKGQILWQKHFETTFVEPVNSRGGGVLCPGGLTATPTIGPAEAPGKYIIYAIAWDGRLHRLNLADGKDIAPPAAFIPPNGKPYALNLFNNVIYTHTAQGCGGNPNMVYTYDLATNKVGSWGPAGGGMWGRSGPAISSNGTLYTGTGDGRWSPENGIYGKVVLYAT